MMKCSFHCSCNLSCYPISALASYLSILRTRKLYIPFIETGRHYISRPGNPTMQHATYLSSDVIGNVTFNLTLARYWRPVEINMTLAHEKYGKKNQLSFEFAVDSWYCQTLKWYVSRIISAYSEANFRLQKDCFLQDKYIVLYEWLMVTLFCVWFGLSAIPTISKGVERSKVWENYSNASRSY